MKDVFERKQDLRWEMERDWFYETSLKPIKNVFARRRMGDGEGLIFVKYF